MDDLPNIPKLAFPIQSNSENQQNNENSIPQISGIPTLNLSSNISDSNNPSASPNIPSIGIPQIGLSQLGVPPIGIPSISSGGLPNSLSNISSNQDTPDIPSIGLNLSTLSQSKRNPISENKTVIICVPFMNKINDKKSQKDLIQYFGDEIDFVEEKLNNHSITIVESVDGENNSIPSFQLIDTAYENVNHLPKMINRVNKEATHMTELVDTILSEIEKSRIEKEELLVQNAVLKEKLRTSVEDTEKFNRSAQNIKKNFDEFFSQISHS